MWASVFGIEQLGIHDNFSQLGGHSLLAMQIVAKIRSSYQIGFTLESFCNTHHCSIEFGRSGKN